MKATKAIFLFILSILALTACSGSDDDGAQTIPENATIACNPSEITATALQGSYTIGVKTTRSEWTAYSESDWATLSLSNTNAANGTITVSVAANPSSTSRSTNIVVKSGSARYAVKLTQLAPLQVSNAEIRMGSVGGTATINVTSTEEWSVSTADSWITVQKTGNVAFTVTTAENNDHAMRIGKVTVKTPTQTLDISVKQESVDDRTMKIPEGYSLFWHDEFDGTTLSSDWTHEIQNAGWVNNELQNYVKNDKVTFLQNGSLNIQCYKDANGKIYSGRIYANRNKGIKYGYVEARILLPKGKGTWPAFWMMPVNFKTWPGDGEIDIMEEVGAVPNEVSSSIHCKAYNHNIGTQKTHAMTISNAEGEYHVYALEWTADYIKTYVDGQPQLTFLNDGKGNNDTRPFNKEFYVILNLAWGGAWGGMNGVDESALPVTMQVDYVRIFKKN